MTELGWVQQFQEFTENNGNTKRMTFASREEAENVARNFGPGATVQEIPNDD